MRAVGSDDGAEIVRLELPSESKKSHASNIRHADIREEMEEGIK